MSDNEKNMSRKFLSQLTHFLENNETDKALSLIQNDFYEDVINEASWDIVPLVSSYLTFMNQECEKNLFECSVLILNVIAEKCNPAETVLEFLEQAEYMEDDIKFCIILKLLNKTLYRTKDKTKAIEWCVNAIRSYSECLPLPENEKTDSAEKTIVKNINKLVQRLINLYRAIISFLEPLVEEAIAIKDHSYQASVLTNYLLSLLIYLSGKPFCCIYDYYFLSISPGEITPHKAITLASSITGDLLHLLPVIDQRSKKHVTSLRKTIHENHECSLKVSLFESRNNISDISYASFYYYLITTPCLWEKVPQVYNPYYILQVCIYFVNCFLRQHEYILIAKGLYFLEEVLNRVAKRTVVAEVLELDLYLEILDSIANIMIFCDNEKSRKKAALIFHEYIKMFNMYARYLVISHLYQISKHSGLLSLITNIFKSSIIECLESKPLCSDFLGCNMESLLRKICRLPHGNGSDLVEIADEVITTLNLLRFLFIRDQCNQTGIWDLTSTLEQTYLEPLREGLDMCKAHWNVKIKDLEEQRRSSVNSDDYTKMEDNVALIVGGEHLPPMPVSEKIKFSYQVINGLDVMESILIRVCECMHNNPITLCKDVKL